MIELISVNWGSGFASLNEQGMEHRLAGDGADPQEREDNIFFKKEERRGWGSSASQRTTSASLWHLQRAWVKTSLH